MQGQGATVAGNASGYQYQYPPPHPNPEYQPYAQSSSSTSSSSSSPAQSIPAQASVPAGGYTPYPTQSSVYSPPTITPSSSLPAGGTGGVSSWPPKIAEGGGSGAQSPDEWGGAWGAVPSTGPPNNNKTASLAGGVVGGSAIALNQHAAVAGGGARGNGTTGGNGVFIRGSMCCGICFTPFHSEAIEPGWQVHLAGLGGGSNKKDAAQGPLEDDDDAEDEGKGNGKNNPEDNKSTSPEDEMNSFQGRKGVFALTCMHLFCGGCLIDYVMNRVKRLEVVDMACPVKGCKCIAPHVFASLLSKEDSDKYEEATMKAFIAGDDSMITCPKCKSGISLQLDIPSGLVNNEKDNDGVALSTEAFYHFKRYRVRCSCGEIFCGECKQSNYHKGFTCQQYKDFMAAPHCRFCDARLRDGVNKPLGKPIARAIANVCTQEDCQKRAANACLMTLKCGCFCGGIRGEALCLPCLKCELKMDDDYCAICYTEAKKSAPCIMSGTHARPHVLSSQKHDDAKLDVLRPDGTYERLPPILPNDTQPLVACRHVFHYHCVVSKLESRWPNARIGFEFRNCPECRLPLFHPSLVSLLQPVVALEQFITHKAVQRLEFEQKHKDKEVADPSGPYYKRKADYALKSFVFYPCHLCKQPYFGGGNQCQEAGGGFDPAELVCPSCQAKTGGQGTNECKKHGTEWLGHKCRFCCKLSTWSCWGNTHFCDMCHKSGTWQGLAEHKTGKNKKKIWEYDQCASVKSQIIRLMSSPLWNNWSQKEKEDELYKIRADPNVCESKVPHPPTGFEFSLGCIMCTASSTPGASSLDMNNGVAAGGGGGAGGDKGKNAGDVSGASSSVVPFKYEYGAPRAQHIGLYSYATLIEHLSDAVNAVEKGEPVLRSPMQQHVVSTAVQTIDNMRAIAFRYQSDFDTNGLFYFLGTLFHSRTWMNPAHLGMVSVTAFRQPVDSLPPEGCLSRAPCRCVTLSDPASYYEINLHFASFAVTSYTLRHYTTFDGECLRNWKLMGSRDGGATWDVIILHKNDQGLNGKSSTKTWHLSSASAYYSRFRFELTGSNSNNNYFMPLAGLEMYGSLVLPRLVDLPSLALPCGVGGSSLLPDPFELVQKPAPTTPAADAAKAASVSRA